MCSGIKMMFHEKYIAGIFAAFVSVCSFFIHAGSVIAAIADCTGTSCIISIYNSASPRDFAMRSVSMAIPTDGGGTPVPITGNQVQITVGAMTQTITCNGVVQNLGSAPYSDLQGTISCTIAGNSTDINANVTLYDLNTYMNYYSTSPGMDIDSTLDGTSVSSPASVSDATGTAYRWLQQNVNDETLTQRGVPLTNWIVFGKTVASISLGYQLTNPPPYAATEQMCMGDVNHNGVIDQDESQSCVTTPQGLLCTVAAETCVASTHPPICTDGVYNTVTDRCENTNPCPSGGTVNNGRCEISSPAVTAYCYTTYDLDWFYVSAWSHINYCTCNNECGVDNRCPCISSGIEDQSGTVTSDGQCSGNTAPGGSVFVGYHRRAETGDHCFRCFRRNYWRYNTYPACPTGFTRSGNVCWRATSCPTGYTLSGSVCAKNPTCNIDYTWSGDNCVHNTPDVCPSGGSACMLYSGLWQCNVYPCQEFGTAITEDDTQEGTNDLKEATINENGECQGNLYVFNGEDQRCRERSVYTGFTSCCYTASSEDDCNKQIWLGFTSCSDDENDLSCKKLKGLCVELDDYCSKTVKVLGSDICVQRKTSYCCYGSKLGRVIQEQGRRQLKVFNHTGSLMPQPADAAERHAQNMHLFTVGGSLNPKTPYCRGFTVEEFSSLNWELMDLKEYTDEVSAEIQSTATQKIQDRIQQLQSNPPQIQTPANLQ